MNVFLLEVVGGFCLVVVVLPLSFGFLLLVLVVVLLVLGVLVGSLGGVGNLWLSVGSHRVPRLLIGCYWKVVRHND